jgi:hypothetical protein
MGTGAGGRATPLPPPAAVDGGGEGGGVNTVLPLASLSPF